MTLTWIWLAAFLAALAIRKAINMAIVRMIFRYGIDHPGSEITIERWRSIVMDKGNIPEDMPSEIKSLIKANWAVIGIGTSFLGLFIWSII
jgi:hypothetical protein